MNHAAVSSAIAGAWLRALLMLLVATGRALAQPFPSKPITLVRELRGAEHTAGAGLVQQHHNRAG